MRPASVRWCRPRPAPLRASWLPSPARRASTFARAWRVAAVVVALSGPSITLAADAEAGRVRAQQACAVCHGALGVANAPDAPHLAGQPAFYLAGQLRAYRNGSRRHEVMAVIAKTLTDDEISNLAAWYASIRVEVQAPR